MCDRNCLDFGIKYIEQSDIADKDVLEVGSYNVNGSLRGDAMRFEPRQYIGIDIAEGLGVDIVCDTNDMLVRFGENSFDTIISTCALEHIAGWRKAISNMKRVCKPGGIILLAVPSAWPYHACPFDYWRYSEQNIKEIFSDFEILVLYEYPKDGDMRVVYLKARKPPVFAEKDISEYDVKSVNTRDRPVGK